jgi:hypothetical protein
MARRFVQFAPFEPDKADYNEAASDATVNVIPTADGWKPLPSLTEISAALGAACLGAVSVLDGTDTVHVFAGTATDLYELNTGTSPYSWTEVSKSSGAYSVPVDEKWTFTLFGNYLVAHSLGDAPQYIDIDSYTLFADLPNAPTARHSWVAGDFLVFGYLTGEPTSIQWSAVNDITFWTIGRRNSDKQVLPSGGEISGGIGDQRGAVIFQRSEIRYMQFAPQTGYTFTIAQANPNRGVVSPYSVVQIGPGRFLYLSEDGFFSGVEGTPIGAERVDEWFQEQADLDYLFEVEGIADPFEKIAWWRFRKPDSSYLLLGYDWQLDRWCYSDTSVTTLAPLLSPAITWDGLDALYDTIDDVNVAFDSRLFKGGRPSFAAISTDGKLAYFTGTPQAATVETANVELVPGQRAFVNGGRLMSDAQTFTAQIGAQEWHGDDVTFDDAVSPSSRSKLIPFRASGRLHRTRINLAAGTDWARASGVYLDYEPEGEA